MNKRLNPDAPDFRICPIILFVILFVFVHCVVAQDVWDGGIDTTWYTSNKSATEYTITTPQQLAGLALLVNGSEDNGTYDMSGKTIKLGNDIILNEPDGLEDWGTNPPANSWEAIGNGYDNSFRGTFDGDGHTVSCVYINTSSSYQGLFGYVYQGTIKNLRIVDSYIKGGSYVGGLVGNNNGGTVSNSYCTGTVTGTESGVNGFVGGLVGYNYSSGTVSNSYATGAVSGSGYFVGGLVGYNSSGTVSNSYYDKETSGRTGGSGIGLTTAEMQNQMFVNFLNIGATTLSMNAWIYSAGKYPELTNVPASSINIISSFANGEGTKANPYIINTKEQLGYLSYSVYLGNNFNGEYFKLGRDIALNSTEFWIAIGNNSKQFRGTFDGDGHTVSGVYINTTSNYQGLFGYLGADGTIKNLGVIDSYIRGGNFVGGLVGYNYSSGTVSNSYSTATVTGNDYVGGLVGSGDTINNSYSIGAVTGNDYVGGLVGSGGTINNSYSTGAVKGSRFVGGLVASGTVTNSYYDTQTSGQTGNYYDNKGIGKTTVEMQSEGFVNLLNIGAGILSMNAWVYLEGKYPELTNTPASAVTYFASGEGTEANPYIIETKEQLETFSYFVNLGNDFNGEYFKLGNDIILNDTTGWQNWETTPPTNFWVAIGYTVYNNNDKPFLGTFDGDEYTISGVYINNTYNYQGLFGYLGESGTIKNVGVVNSYIKGGNQSVGGLVGLSYGIISNSHYIGTVTGTASVSEYVGGLVGNSYGAISNSYSTGIVTGYDVGGLVGQNSAGTISNSYSTSAVTGVGDYRSFVGGLVGYNSRGTISNSYSIGAVTGELVETEETRVGGLVGANFDGTVSNSYYDVQTSRQTGYGGAGRTTAEMQSQLFTDVLNLEATTLSMSAWIYTEGKYPTLSNTPANTAEIDIASYFESGNGTETNPYIIKTKGQLEAFSFIVNLGNDFNGKYFKLGNDIALNDTTGWQNWGTTPPANSWTAIGGLYNSNTGYSSFCGTFDGEGYVVSGVYINSTIYHQGLFGYLGEGGTIKNVGVVGSYIKSNYWVGGLLGHNGIGTVVSNSYFKGAVIGNDYIGGLVGYGGRISNSYSAGTVTGNNDVGGLVGHGGMVINSYSTSTVTGNENVGGLVGYGSTVSNSYSTGTVTGNNSVGGLVGSQNGAVTKSYYETQTSGQTEGYGTGKTTEEMQSQEFVNLLNIEATNLSMNAWVYSEGKYPTLSSELANVTPTIPHRENPSIGGIGVQTISNGIMLTNLPTNAKVEVYNLNGKRVYSNVRALPATPSLSIPVQTKGVYIVRVGGQAISVVVR